MLLGYILQCLFVHGIIECWLFPHLYGQSCGGAVKPAILMVLKCNDTEGYVYLNHFIVTSAVINCSVAVEISLAMLRFNDVCTI